MTRAEQARQALTAIILAHNALQNFLRHYPTDVRTNVALATLPALRAALERQRALHRHLQQIETPPPAHKPFLGCAR